MTLNFVNAVIQIHPLITVRSFRERKLPPARLLYVVATVEVISNRHLQEHHIFLYTDHI